MDIESIYARLDEIPGRSIKLDQKQKEIIEFGDGPLWIIAGPGSGKTEVLVLRCLKLLVVDEITPKSIMITTFTEKAARNIEDRLTSYLDYLSQFDDTLRDIEASFLRTGTLHSLCNAIMQEYRYEHYKNYRLLDELEKPLFIYAHSKLVNHKQSNDRYVSLWHHFHYLVDRWNPSSGYLPSRWSRVKAATMLFDRIVEDLIDVDKLRQKGGAYETLAEAYEDYANGLEKHFRCDFANLQERFIDFLSSPKGALFVDGDGSNDHPGIKYVLVDEYQDTNPIQEAIYLKLADPAPHNLCVVGDDDQALYRFRGGTVECMVNFDKACQRAWGLDPQMWPKSPLGAITDLTKRLSTGAIVTSARLAS